MRRNDLEHIFYGSPSQPHPWATDCPVKFEAWLELAKLGPGGRPNRAKLILSVDEEFGVREVLESLTNEGGIPEDKLLASGSFIAASITLAELAEGVLPLTSVAPLVEEAHRLTGLREFASSGVEEERQKYDYGYGERSRARRRENLSQLKWFVNLMLSVVEEVIPRERQSEPRAAAAIGLADYLSAAAEPRWLMADAPAGRHRRFPIASVTVNRAAMGAVSRSRATIKADAAERVFSVDCSDIGWAILDSGIDATHPAFYEWNSDDEAGASRIRRIFDFVDLQRSTLRVKRASIVDWADKLPSIEMEVPGGTRTRRTQGIHYRSPLSPHGTHVAGILGGKWPAEGLFGVSPSIQLYDFRVLGDSGNGDEFAVIAAMQAVRYINEQAGRLVIAGVNISLSIPQDMSIDSCGWTPVCIEANRLVRSGVVVVTAAGNSGYTPFNSGVAGSEHRQVSISDPGNAEAVITVGSTHPSHPHRHGVSYFSGRGPTADGRPKPDILAPGERIEGPVPAGQIATMYGTSQAAPHVSGAAAMLLARNRELLGQPERVKEILCSTATDLRRDRWFQGSGLVDVLRALQAV